MVLKLGPKFWSDVQFMCDWNCMYSIIHGIKIGIKIGIEVSIPSVQLFGKILHGT